MYRKPLALLALLLISAAPALSRSRTADAVDAANAAKAGFRTEGDAAGPAVTATPGAPNQSLEVVVAALNADGTVVVENPRDGRRLTLDPQAIPELIAQDKSKFDGRKHLVAADLAVGHRLKIIFRGGTSEILRAKVLKDRRS